MNYRPHNEVTEFLHGSIADFTDPYPCTPSLTSRQFNYVENYNAAVDGLEGEYTSFGMATRLAGTPLPAAFPLSSRCTATSTTLLSVQASPASGLSWPAPEDLIRLAPEWQMWFMIAVPTAPALLLWLRRSSERPYRPLAD
jgi:hypothetical protein